MGKAFEVSCQGRRFLAQQVLLTSGLGRTAYFERSKQGLVFDAPSFFAESSAAWEAVRKEPPPFVPSLAARLQPPASIPFGICRVYGRPDDYYSARFSPADFLSLRIEDVERCFEARAYVVRARHRASNSCASSESATFRAPRACPGDRNWRELPLTLELCVDVESLQDTSPDFQIVNVASSSWLLVDRLPMQRDY